MRHFCNSHCQQSFLLEFATHSPSHISQLRCVMSVFHGNKHNEDSEEFLSWYLQCMRTGDDASKAWSFVNYLQVYSDTNKWFEELPEEEKRSWSSIEALF